AVCTPIAFAAANSFAAKRCCMSGSPPLNVKPPPITLRPRRYLLSSATAVASVTGIPFVIVQVSGLWQYRQRHMQPLVQATPRTPGPSTAEPVVKEWRKPMSPVARAVRTSDSGRSFPRLTRSSKGFGASRRGRSRRARSDIRALAVKRPVDHVHMLFARESEEVDRIAGDAKGQVRVLVGVTHCIDPDVAIQHGQVHGIAKRTE